MPDQTTTQGPEIARESSEGYPDDGWLRGYFFETECDVKAGSRASAGLHKNLDFMRLRDWGLHLLDPRPGMVVLDVGCADGASMVYCGLQGATVYGQDLDPKQVTRANRFLKQYEISGAACVGDAARMEFPDNMFDGAISSDFFEHVTDDQKAAIFREVKRVLKPGAKLVIKTPNLNYLRLSLYRKRVLAILRLKNPSNIVIPHTPGTDDPQHIGLTTRRGLTCSLVEAGFMNYQFLYAPLRRFGLSPLVETLSTEIPVIRDWFCEDLFCVAWKPIAFSHFPE